MQQTNLLYKHADSATCPHPNTHTVFRKEGKPDIQLEISTGVLTTKGTTKKFQGAQEVLLAANWVESDSTLKQPASAEALRKFHSPGRATALGLIFTVYNEQLYILLERKTLGFEFYSGIKTTLKHKNNTLVKSLSAAVRITTSLDVGVKDWKFCNSLEFTTIDKNNLLEVYACLIENECNLQLKEFIQSWADSDCVWLNVQHIMADRLPLVFDSSTLSYMLEAGKNIPNNPLTPSPLPI